MTKSGHRCRGSFSWQIGLKVPLWAGQAGVPLSCLGWWGKSAVGGSSQLRLRLLLLLVPVPSCWNWLRSSEVKGVGGLLLSCPGFSLEVTNDDERLSATDVLATTTMKNAAKRDM
jgi:hypothetical protein